MSVAKPWIVSEPDPTTSHSLDGLPGSEFSHAITLATGGSHDACGLGWRVGAGG